MPDLFQRKVPPSEAPITADHCTLTWDGDVMGATQVTISFQQQINRRRVIGNKLAAIWGSSPQGQANIQRLLVGADASAIFGKEGWDVCTPTTVIFKAGTSECGGGNFTLKATGCIVASYQIQAEAESLTVMDNVVIEFLQLEKTA